MDSDLATESSKTPQAPETVSAVLAPRDTHPATTLQSNVTNRTKCVLYGSDAVGMRQTVEKECPMEPKHVVNPTERTQAGMIQASRAAKAETVGPRHHPHAKETLLADGTNNRMRPLPETSPRETSRADGVKISPPALPPQGLTASPSSTTARAGGSSVQPRLAGKPLRGHPQCSAAQQRGLAAPQHTSRHTAAVVAQWVQDAYRSSGPDVRFAAFLCSTCAEPAVVEAFNAVLPSSNASCVGANKVTVFTPLSFSGSFKPDPAGHSSQAEDESARGSQTQKPATYGMVTEKTHHPPDGVRVKSEASKGEKTEVPQPGGGLLQPPDFGNSRLMQKVLPAALQKLVDHASSETPKAGLQTCGPSSGGSDNLPSGAEAVPSRACSTNPDLASSKHKGSRKIHNANVQEIGGSFSSGASHPTLARGKLPAPVEVRSHPGCPKETEITCRTDAHIQDPQSVEMTCTDPCQADDVLEMQKAPVGTGRRLDGTDAGNPNQDSDLAQHLPAPQGGVRPPSFPLTAKTAQQPLQPPDSCVPAPARPKSKRRRLYTPTFFTGDPPDTADDTEHLDQPALLHARQEPMSHDGVGENGGALAKVFLWKGIDPDKDQAVCTTKTNPSTSTLTPDHQAPGKESGQTTDALQPIWDIMIAKKFRPPPWLVQRLRSKLHSSTLVALLEEMLTGQRRPGTKYPSRVYEAYRMITSRKDWSQQPQIKSGKRGKKKKSKSKSSSDEDSWSNQFPISLRKSTRECTKPATTAAARRSCGYQLRSLVPPPQPPSVTGTSEVPEASQSSQQASTGPGASGDSSQAAPSQTQPAAGAPASKLSNKKNATTVVQRPAADCSEPAMFGQGDAPDETRKINATKTDEASFGTWKDIVQEILLRVALLKNPTPMEILEELRKTAGLQDCTNKSIVQALPVSVDGKNNMAANKSEKALEKEKKKKGEETAATNKSKGTKRKTGPIQSVKPKPAGHVETLETRLDKKYSLTTIPEMDVTRVDKNACFGNKAPASKNASQAHKASLPCSLGGDRQPMQKCASQPRKLISGIWEMKKSGLHMSNSFDSESDRGEMATNARKDLAVSDDDLFPMDRPRNRRNPRGKSDLCVILDTSDAFLIRNASINCTSSDEGESRHFNGARKRSGNRKQNVTVYSDDTLSPTRDGYSTDEVYHKISKTSQKSATRTRAPQTACKSSAARKTVKVEPNIKLLKFTAPRTQHRPTDFNKRRPIYPTLPCKSCIRHVCGKKAFAKTRKMASPPKPATRMRSRPSLSSCKKPRDVGEYHAKLHSAKMVHPHVFEALDISDRRPQLTLVCPETHSYERKHTISGKCHHTSGKSMFPHQMANAKETVSHKKRKKLTHDAFFPFPRGKRFKSNNDWPNVSMQEDILEARSIRSRKRKRTLYNYDAFSLANSDDSRKPDFHCKKISSKGNSQADRRVSKGKRHKPSLSPYGIERHRTRCSQTFHATSSKRKMHSVLSPRLSKWTLDLDFGLRGSKASHGDLIDEASLRLGRSSRDTNFVLGKDHAQKQWGSRRKSSGTFQVVPTQPSSNHPQIGNRHSHGPWTDFNASSQGPYGNKTTCCPRFTDDIDCNYEALLGMDVMNRSLPLDDLNSNNNCVGDDEEMPCVPSPAPQQGAEQTQDLFDLEDDLLDVSSFDSLDGATLEEILLLMGGEYSMVFDQFLFTDDDLPSNLLADDVGEGSYDTNHCGSPSSWKAKHAKSSSSVPLNDPVSAEDLFTSGRSARAAVQMTSLMCTRDDEGWRDPCTCSETEEVCKSSTQSASDVMARNHSLETARRLSPWETGWTQRKWNSTTGFRTTKSSPKKWVHGMSVVHAVASPRGSPNASHVPRVGRRSIPLLPIPSSGAKPKLAMSKAQLKYIKRKIDEFLYNSRKLRVGICRRLKKKAEGTVQKRSQAPISTVDVKSAQCTPDPKSSSSKQVKVPTVEDTAEPDACTCSAPTTTVDAKCARCAPDRTRQSLKQVRESMVDDSHESNECACSAPTTAIDVRLVQGALDPTLVPLTQVGESRVADTDGQNPVICSATKTSVGVKFTRCDSNPTPSSSKQAQKLTVGDVHGSSKCTCSAPKAGIVKSGLCDPDPAAPLSKQVKKLKVESTHGANKCTYSTPKTAVKTIECDPDPTPPSLTQGKNLTMEDVCGSSACASPVAEDLETAETISSPPSLVRFFLERGCAANFKRKRQLAADSSDDCYADGKQTRNDAAEVSDEVSSRDPFLDLQSSETPRVYTEDPADNPPCKRRKLQEDTSTPAHVHREGSPTAHEQGRRRKEHTLAEEVMSKGLTSDKPAKVSVLLRLGKRVETHPTSPPEPSACSPGRKRTFTKTRKKPTGTSLAADVTMKEGDPMTLEAKAASSTGKPPPLQCQPQTEGQDSQDQDMQTDQRKVVRKRDREPSTQSVQAEETPECEGPEEAPDEVTAKKPRLDAGNAKHGAKANACDPDSRPTTKYNWYGPDVNADGEESFYENESSTHWSWYQPYPNPRYRSYAKQNMKWTAQHNQNEPKEYADFDLKEITSRKKLLQDLTTSNFKRKRLERHLWVSHPKLPPRFRGLVSKVRTPRHHQDTGQNDSSEKSRSLDLWQEILMAESAATEEIGTLRSKLAENYDDMLQEMLPVNRALPHHGDRQRSPGGLCTGGDAIPE